MGNILGVVGDSSLGPCDWHGCHTADDIAEALKDPTHPASVQIIDLLNMNRHPAPHLPYGGCMKPMGQLMIADGRIHALPIAEQATYADMVVRAVAHQPDDAMFIQIGGDDALPPDADSSAVGAMAYCALYAANEGVRQRAAATLAAYTAATQ